MRRILFATLVVCASCNDSTGPLETAEPGVVLTYPADAQVDVPTGAHIVVTFSDAVDASALGICSGSGSAVSGGFCLVGPNGVVEAMPTLVGDKTVEYATNLDPGASYAVYIGAALAPFATNLPAAGTPLVHFTTRSTRPKSAVPTLVAVNGGDPTLPDSFRPMLEATTIELLFSEPLDSRTVTLGTGAIELVDGANAAVPVTVLTDGIHVALDPKADLIAGSSYTLRLGNRLLDRTGQALAPLQITLTPKDSHRGNAPIQQVLKTRMAGDPGTTTSRTGYPTNALSIAKPLIGANSANVLSSELPSELGNPLALGGPIAFTIRKGARLRTSGLDVKLGGVINSGLSTGEIEIELLTDGGGRLYRNPHQAADQRPENARAPLYVDLSMDVAIYAVDPKGNAVLSQTILGLQGVGVVSATDGVLDIETIASLDLGLLGVTAAPTNLVLELFTETGSTSSALSADTTPPTLVTTLPTQNEHDVAVDQGVDLVFSEPIDLDRARAGGIELQTGAGVAVPYVIESRGAAVTVRPVNRLARSSPYKVLLTDVADAAGNPLATTSPIAFTTSSIANTSNPVAVTAAHPGVGCALTAATATSPGRCTGGKPTDDLYHPFALASDEPAEVAFDQPVVPTSLTLGTACNTGSVRFEEVDGSGACTAAVKGSLIIRERSFQFVPDVPWVAGKAYKMTLVSGGNSACDANEICGVSDAASFDILASMDGTGASGGPNVVVAFTGKPPSGATYMLTQVAPLTDLNGSGTVDGIEVLGDTNQATMHVDHTDGVISSASFTSASCPGGTSGDGCLFITGAMSVEMLPLQMGCSLPDGSMAASCMPVAIDPGLMYGTTASLKAVTNIFGINLSTDTKTAVMRVREPASGPVTGYIIDDHGTPSMVVNLSLYMDAPDMSILASSHDLHSKELALSLKGPLTFLPDGRISIAVANTADIPLKIHIDTTIAGGSNVYLVLPAGQMKLQLLSPALRSLQ
ncbi:hypothetical protein BH11MYX1_BH11MYX1_34100 [soil metagenome]